MDAYSPGPADHVGPPPMTSMKRMPKGSGMERIGKVIPKEDKLFRWLEYMLQWALRSLTASISELRDLREGNAGSRLEPASESQKMYCWLPPAADVALLKDNGTPLFRASGVKGGMVVDTNRLKINKGLPSMRTG